MKSLTMVDLCVRPWRWMMQTVRPTPRGELNGLFSVMLHICQLPHLGPWQTP